MRLNGFRRGSNVRPSTRADLGERLTNGRFQGLTKAARTPDMGRQRPFRMPGLMSRCLIPGFDGALFTAGWRDALWARFSTAAPRRRRRSVERYNIVKRACGPCRRGLSRPVQVGERQRCRQSGRIIPTTCGRRARCGTGRRGNRRRTE